MGKSCSAVSSNVWKRVPSLDMLVSRVADSIGIVSWRLSERAGSGDRAVKKPVDM